MPSKRKLHQLFVDENAATAIEYGLFAAIIGLGVIASANGLGAAVQQLFRYVLDGVTNI